MKLVDGNDPILKEPCEKFNFLKPQRNIVDLANELIQEMNDNNGLGISANQIGIPLQVFVMRTNPTVVVVNPKIIEYSKETVELEEGCLSYPGDLIKVSRPIWIIARFHGVDSVGQTQKFEGMTARVFQHEYDHMIGKTMFDHLSKLKREMYLKKKEKRNKNATNNNGLINAGGLLPSMSLGQSKFS
jgi:peptide deformylase